VIHLIAGLLVGTWTHGDLLAGIEPHAIPTHTSADDPRPFPPSPVPMPGPDPTPEPAPRPEPAPQPVPPSKPSPPATPPATPPAPLRQAAQGGAAPPVIRDWYDIQGQPHVQGYGWIGTDGYLRVEQYRWKPLWMMQAPPAPYLGGYTDGCVGGYCR
jgi:hypothetical protein